MKLDEIVENNWLDENLKEYLEKEALGRKRGKLPLSYHKASYEKRFEFRNCIRETYGIPPEIRRSDVNY